MSKRAEEILRGMPREDLRVREDYRDDGLRVKLATHYLIGYLGNETPENNRAVYSGKEIATVEVAREDSDEEETGKEN